MISNAIIGGGSEQDPDLTVFDYSKFTNILQPTNTYWMTTFTGKKAKVTFPDSWNGVVPSFYGAPSTLEEVEIVCNGAVTGVVENKMCYSSSGIRKITLNFSTELFNSNKFDVNFFFRGLGTSANPLVIDGQPLDFSGVASDTATLCRSGFFYQSYIGYVRFAPNTLNMSGTFYVGTQNIDEDSYVSLCNVLGETVTGVLNPFTLYYLNKTMGRVETSQGYSLFVKDPNGTLSLADFVTQVKGWTLA